MSFSAITNQPDGADVAAVSEEGAQYGTFVVTEDQILASGERQLRPQHGAAAPEHAWCLAGHLET
ncbi:MAG: hypothetical protein KatS3mg059_0351 [Thermomicrobiales bacterium]|nr:MAG: hypothetical protein KatS3mg059_0351 [Thermomicrobiales bacterium]